MHLSFYRFLCSLCPYLGLGDALLCRRQREPTRGRGGLYEPRAPRRRRRQMLERLPDPSLHLDSRRTHDSGVAGKWTSVNDVTYYWIPFVTFCDKCPCHDTYFDSVVSGRQKFVNDVTKLWIIFVTFCLVSRNLSHLMSSYSIAINKIIGYY